MAIYQSPGVSCMSALVLGLLVSIETCRWLYKKALLGGVIG